jgi:hypothetical protein
MSASPSPWSAVEPITSPRTYRIHPGWRWFFLVAGLTMAGFVGWLLAHEAARGNPAPLGIALGLGLGFPVLSLALAWALGRARVTISPDSVELVEWSRPRRLLREQIRGFRVVPLQYGQSLVELEPRHPGGRKLRIYSTFRVDAAFRAWLSTLPDLDAEDRERAHAELLASPALGATAPERERTIAATRRMTRALNVVASASAAWALFYPRPYLPAVATCAAMVPLALLLALLRRGQISLEGGRNDPRAQLIPALFLPGFALVLRAMLDVQLLRYAPAIGIAAAGGVLACLLLLASDPRLRGRAWVLLLMAPFLALHPYGAAVLADRLLDRSEDRRYEAEVLERSVSTGKVTTYNLRLGPWGPRDRPESVEVSRRVYDRVDRGAIVSVVVRDGALGMPWYVVRPER